MEGKTSQTLQLNQPLSSNCNNNYEFTKGQDLHNLSLHNSKNVILKPLQNKRGRPKGSQLNAIGLPKKSKTCYCKKFVLMTNFEKTTIIFEWILKKKSL